MRIAKTTTHVTEPIGDRAGFGHAELQTLTFDRMRVGGTGEVVPVFNLGCFPIAPGQAVFIEEPADQPGCWFILTATEPGL